MKNKTMFAMVALSMVALLGVSGLAAAQGWFGFQATKPTQADIQEIQSDHKAMQDAITNKDFTTWKMLMEKQVARMQSQITEENFNAIVDREAKMQEFKLALKEAKASGDYSKVQELQKKYGLNFHPMGRGMMHQQLAN